MRAIHNSQNLIGKLIYFDKPLFKFNKILDPDESFPELLEERTPLKFSAPIIEPPNPSKVLGKYQSTLVFDFVTFKDKSFEHLDFIRMGFGEHGYYYDLHLKFEIEEDIRFEKIQSLINEINKISIMIENEFSELYFINPEENNKREISNFSMTIQFDKPLFEILDPKLRREFEKLAHNSEDIIPNVENRINFNFGLNFYPKIVEEGMIFNPKEIIMPGRTIKFIRDISKPNQNNYSINIRGLPPEPCINFLRIIESV